MLRRPSFPIAIATLITLVVGFAAGCFWATARWEPLYGQAPGDSLPIVTAGSALFTKIQNERSLTIGVNSDAPPLSMQTRDGQLIGIDVEIARMIGQELGVAVELVRLTSSERFDALLEGRVDLLVAAVTRTPERGLLVDFSKPYLVFSQAALIRKDLLPNYDPASEVGSGPSFERWSDLGKVPGLKLGVKTDTQPETLARKSFPLATVVGFPSVLDAVKALQRGEVGAVAHDGPFIEAWILTHGSQRFKLKPLLGASTTEHLGIAIRKGDLEFLAWLDLFVEEAAARGSLSTIRNHYLSNDGWAKNVDWD